MNFLIINGSLSKESYSNALLQYMNKFIINLGYKIENFNFYEFPLPFFNIKYYPININKNYQIFLQKIENANGFIIITPIYHSSLTGVLKNGLDHLPATIFNGKPVGLANVGGGVRSGQPACDHLQTIIRSMSGYVMQEQVGCYFNDFKYINKKLILKDEVIIKRSNKLILELIYMAKKLKN